MKCEICNQEFDDALNECPHCGAAVQIAEQELPTQELPEQELPEQELPEQESAPVQESKKAPVWKIVLAALAGALVGAAMLLAVLWGCGVFSAEAPTEPSETKPNSAQVDSYTVEDALALEKADTVIAAAGEQKLTNGALQVFYWSQIYDFLSYNGTYYFDVSKPLDEQFYSEADGITWQHYFLEIALETWHRYAALSEMANEQGFTLSQEQLDMLQALRGQLEEMAATYELESVDALIQADFGPGCNFASYEAFMRLNTEALEFYNGEYEEMMPTDEEVNAYYTENEAALVEQGYVKGEQLVDVRHILIEPEGGTTDENNQTTYTDAEMEACRAEAQKVLDTWLAGEATQESFAALATELTDDTYSAPAGGLYEDVYKGQMLQEFEAWCFDETRKPGDYGLVQTVHGYHIMYFVQFKESNAWYEGAQQLLIQERTEALLEQAQEKCPIEVSYEDIVLGYVNLAG